MAAVGLLTGMSVAAMAWLLATKLPLSSLLPVTAIPAIWCAGALFAVFDMRDSVAGVASEQPHVRRRPALRALAVAACVSVAMALAMSAAVPALWRKSNSGPNYAAASDAG